MGGSSAACCRGSLKSSGLPGDAVRGGSIYLPCGEQVHGHRPVESAAPGEAQPAASLRHGPGGGGAGGCGRDGPTPSWGCLQTGEALRRLGVCVSAKVEPRRHALRASSFLRPVRGPSRSGWEPQWGGGESRAGASPELVVPATALRRCEEGWGELLLLLLLLHRGTGGGGASKRRRRDAVQA